jgi:hypothetical protein
MSFLAKYKPHALHSGLPSFLSLRQNGVLRVPQFLQICAEQPERQQTVQDLPECSQPRALHGAAGCMHVKHVMACSASHCQDYTNSVCLGVRKKQLHGKYPGTSHLLLLHNLPATLGLTVSPASTV